MTHQGLAPDLVPGHPEPAADGAATRARLAALADRMLAAVRPHASPGHGRITLPGPEGGYGRAIDGLEGFARTFLLGGFRLAGERGADPDNLAEWYARGIAAGVDPDAPDRWVRMSEHGQAKVEAASLALVLDLTRPWIWDRLDAVTQERTVTYLAECIGDTTYPRNNWVWFRIVVQTFLKSVGGPWSAQDVADDLAFHDSCYRTDGWFSDGEERAYDHYVGWAMHLYPALWARMAGAEELAAPRRAGDRARLDRFLEDAVALVGGDGSPLLQGRSLIYRFAAAAPYWVGAVDEVPSVSPGLLRTAAASVVGHFTDRGVPGTDGLLSTGWHHEWRPLAQDYSGTGSPYWASKGLLGLALPADHPVWTAPAEPLPVQRGDVLRAVRAPGWIVAGTRSDGVVRVINHGTDHAREGDRTGDSPLYARLGYSTATSPWLDAASWLSPAGGSVALVAMAGELAGQATHRTGMTLLATRVDEGVGADAAVGVAASRATAHWLAPDDAQVHHGSGRHGAATDAGTLTVVSLVRGAWEVRLARVDALADGVTRDGVRLRVSGWPVVDGDGLDSVVAPLATGTPADAATTGSSGTEERTDVSPLCPPGAASRAPWVETAVVPGEWVAVAVGLGAALGPARPTLALADETAVVTWPDGRQTSTDLPAHAGATTKGSTTSPDSKESNR
ncbi:DUF2264 domain-containing protein [Xylanimonas sp. McL0601]|uniref:DUF2264 domain-containing protein n=1 Tax=Xylanimonas sp. McL0601 TaxID=3414739 RepID=UPI003CF18799